MSWSCVSCLEVYSAVSKAKEERGVSKILTDYTYIIVNIALNVLQVQTYIHVFMIYFFIFFLF